MKSKYLLIFFCILAHFNTLAQKSYEMELANFEQEDERGFTFEVRIRNTNPIEPFGIEAIQWQLTFNTALMNGGAFQNAQLTYVAGTSQMDGSRMIPLSALFTTNQVVLNWITDNLNADERTTYLNDADWRTIGKFRARLRTASTGTTVQNFADVLHNLSFNPSQVGVTWCEVYYDEEGAEGAGWYRTGSDFEEITSRILTNSLNPTIQLAGYYMNTGTDWTTASNWNNAVASAHPAYHQLPGASNNALVGVDAVISETSQITINNAYLTSTGSLTIESSPTSTGSLMHNNPGLLATIQRYIAAADWGVDGDGWHLISTPVSGQVISFDWAPDGLSSNDYDFYGWDEPTQTWLNQKDPDNGMFSFLPGEGYLVAYQEAGTKTFSGAVQVETLADIPITRTGTPATDNHVGWNLLGNPFASALLWGGDDWGDVAAVAKIWSETDQGYIDINPGVPIPSANGIFVFSTQESGLISLNASSRTHNSTPWYKSDNERILLVAGDALGLTAQQSVVRFNPEATEGFDNSFDAYFMAGYAPMFYSVADEKRFSTNTLPEMTGGMNIPFGFHKNSNTDFFIEMQETISDVIVNLTDLKLNHTQNLSEQPVYTFTSASGDDANRFLLSFTTVGNQELPVANLLQAYTYGSMLYVLSPAEKAMVEVYNTQGQLILSQETGQGLSNISLSVPSGSYIVKMTSASETATRKVVIN